MTAALVHTVLRGLSTVRHAFRRHFTPAGRGLLAALTAAAVFGLDTNRNVAYQVFTLLLALLLIAFATSVKGSVRLVARRQLPRFGSVGAPLGYRLVVVNEGKIPTGPFPIGERLADPRPSLPQFRAAIAAGRGGSWLNHWQRLWQSNRLAQPGATLLPLLPPGGEAELLLELTPLRRGRLHLPMLEVERRDVFGLFCRYSLLPATQSVNIIPRRYPIPPIPLPGSRAYQHGGLALSASVADAEEFQSLREYRPGDPPRLIHWKSWARSGKPVIKEFQEEFFVRHALILDTFSGTAAADDLFEEAVSVAASFAYTVSTRESLLDLLFVGTEAYCETIGRGQGQEDHLLEVLAGVRYCADKPFATLTRHVISRVHAMSGCICVLLGWDDDRRALVKELRVRGVQVLVLVVTGGGTVDPPGSRGEEETGSFHVLTAGAIGEGLARL